jgi:GNAT superfamily N-acetyltransferase
METPPVGPAVTAPGAWCRLGPSPTALAIRLEGLQARDVESLDALLDQLQEPPWDVEVDADDSGLIAVLAARGFEEYLRTTLFVRSAEGFSASRVPGVEVVKYENAWAPALTAAERDALDGLTAFAELGSPSGYEWGEGQGSFRIARTLDGRMVGFAHANLPDGVVDWLGVVPERRRTGIGRLLLSAVARDVADARGTHLLVHAQDGTSGGPFLSRLGFAARGRRVSLIYRGGQSPPSAGGES